MARKKISRKCKVYPSAAEVERYCNDYNAALHQSQGELIAQWRSQLARLVKPFLSEPQAGIGSAGVTYKLLNLGDGCKIYVVSPELETKPEKEQRAIELQLARDAMIALGLIDTIEQSEFAPQVFKATVELGSAFQTMRFRPWEPIVKEGVARRNGREVGRGRALEARLVKRDKVRDEAIKRMKVLIPQMKKTPAAEIVHKALSHLEYQPSARSILVWYNEDLAESAAT